METNKKHKVMSQEQQKETAYIEMKCCKDNEFLATFALAVAVLLVSYKYILG